MNQSDFAICLQQITDGVSKWEIGESADPRADLEQKLASIHNSATVHTSDFQHWMYCMLYDHVIMIFETYIMAVYSISPFTIALVICWTGPSAYYLKGIGSIQRTEASWYSVNKCITVYSDELTQWNSDT